jgi:hypothetical protein
MTTWRRALTEPVETVLPWLGGPFADGGDHRLRVVAAPPGAGPGWWCFRVDGREAVALAPAGPPDLSGLPQVEGHLAGPYLAVPGARAELLGLGPGAPLPLLAPVVARRWPSGTLVFDRPAFESGAEEEARLAYDRRGRLDAQAAPGLRDAYAYVLAGRLAAERGIRVAPAELWADAPAIAEGGEPAAQAALDRLVDARAGRRPPRLPRRRPDADLATGAGHPDGPGAEVLIRAERALTMAGAALLECRLLDGGLAEVRYRLDGERYVSVVEAATLDVVDPGACPDLPEGRVPLEGLPGLLRQAVAAGTLVITRWA